jgi:hypothetical protein
MRIVIVKHENCGQKYLFEVPKGEFLSAGDLVKVQTKRGKQLATCLSDHFDIDENSEVFKNILSAFGASEPLSKVLGQYRYIEFSEEENI